ncbi:MAG: hypothetical protein KAJ73_10150 [Zetaproteobacteria bacterium]|nr:hypothetical protein [Zetaproteobacteria bacterium]
MAEGKENLPVYEVLFVFDAKVPGKKGKTEQKIIGPIRVPAKTEGQARWAAGVYLFKNDIAAFKELANADIFKLEIKAKRF